MGGPDLAPSPNCFPIRGPRPSRKLWPSRTRVARFSTLGISQHWQGYPEQNNITNKQTNRQHHNNKQTNKHIKRINQTNKLAGIP